MKRRIKILITATCVGIALFLSGDYVAEKHIKKVLPPPPPPSTGLVMYDHWANYVSLAQDNDGNIICRYRPHELMDNEKLLGSIAFHIENPHSSMCVLLPTGTMLPLREQCQAWYQSDLPISSFSHETLLQAFQYSKEWPECSIVEGEWKDQKTTHKKFLLKSVVIFVGMWLGVVAAVYSVFGIARSGYSLAVQRCRTNRSRCINCGYDLSSVLGKTCPECGHGNAIASEAATNP